MRSDLYDLSQKKMLYVEKNSIPFEYVISHLGGTIFLQKHFIDCLNSTV